MLKRPTSSRIGFMQGRLSPLRNGLIQSFPWENWRNEFEIANSLDFNLMEWTLDQDQIMKNPLMTLEGRNEILGLTGSFQIEIPSLTGDCFMQAPFWKKKGLQRDCLLEDFRNVVDACFEAGIGLIIIPLVDNGSLKNSRQEFDLVACLVEMQSFFLKRKVRIVFESDYSPPELMRFISRLEPETFGINYDIGNSAALGFDAQEEIITYGERILNVHIKDRLRGGNTVPLGSGAADFSIVFRCLSEIGYDGNYILQTARASDANHAGVLGRYQKMALSWIEQYAA